MTAMPLRVRTGVHLGARAVEGRVSGTIDVADDLGAADLDAQQDSVGYPAGHRVPGWGLDVRSAAEVAAVVAGLVIGMLRSAGSG